MHVRSITSALHHRGCAILVAVRATGEGNPLPTVDRVVKLKKETADAQTQLRQLMQQEHIDLVVERYSLSSAAARTASKELGIPLLLEVNAPLVAEARRFRGLDDPSADDRERQTFREADHIHVVSSALGRYVQSLAPDVPFTWVPNGVDVDTFRSARPEPLPELAGKMVIGFTGSMKPWHGTDELLEAFARVCARRQDVALVLVGSGPSEEAVATRSARGDLRGRVIRTGHVEHARVPGIVKRFDIAVAPYSAAESFYFSPLKVLEYLAAEVPIVYSDQGDLREIVDGGGVGYPPGDVEGLAGLLCRLADDGDYRSSLAAAGKERAMAFAWEAVADRLLSIGDQLTASTRAP